MKRNALILTLAVALFSGNAFAFNLWKDIEEQTEWKVGDSVSAGTAVNLRNGQYCGSALAQIAQYRFLSAWYGGTFIPQADQSLRAVDTAKIGLNLGYIFSGFKNQPPAFLTRLVIGPSFAIPLFSTPHKGTPFIDINYQFGAPAYQKTTAAP